MLVVRILVSFFVRVQYWHVHNRFIAFYHKGNQNRVCLTLTHIAESVIVPYIPLLLCSIFLKFKSASRKKRPQTIKALIFGGVGFKTSNVVPPQFCGLRIWYYFATCSSPRQRNIGCRMTVYSWHTAITVCQSPSATQA